MEHYYSNDINAQIIVSLLKSHGISKVIASPGVTDMAVVGSMQIDSFFEMYSCVDERGAAYMACGLASESQQPVAIVCTEATASRNYMPALTEAFYRQLPIAVLTGTHSRRNTGHLFTQSIDRTNTPNDIVRCSVFLDEVKDDSDKKHNAFECSRALLELFHHGSGPVHINFVANGAKGFTTKTLPLFSSLKRYVTNDRLPKIPLGKIVIFAGSGMYMSKEEVDAIDRFCSCYDSVVLCDHTSGYHGSYGVCSSLICCQHHHKTVASNADLLIHIGEVSGDTYSVNVLKPKTVWRVNPDGKAKNLFGALDSIFEMDLYDFFRSYTDDYGDKNHLLNELRKEYDKLLNDMPDMGFGNIFVAQSFAPSMPMGCAMHFAIFNSFRSWSFFGLDPSIECTANVGGFGIDGAPSTALGASLANPNRLHFLVTGDLAFFYDMNAIGSRHVMPNLRILLVNNGRGVEFRKKDNPGHLLGDDADLYVAAAGHYGKMSSSLVKHYVTDLGFEYMSASTKEELIDVKNRFLTPKMTDRPMFLEIFPDYHDDVDNIDEVRRTQKTIDGSIKDIVKKVIK